eukprot:Colp12_sorted_trinity150504_noHs@12137
MLVELLYVLCYILKVLHVEHEAILHVVLLETVKGLVDLGNGHKLSHREQVVLAGKIDHLLKVDHATDEGSRDAHAGEDDSASIEAVVVAHGRNTQENNAAINLKAVNICLQVVGGADGIKDHIQRAGGSCKLGLVRGDDELRGTKLAGLSLLLGGGGEYSHLASPCNTELNRDVTKTTKTSHAELHASLEAESLHGVVNSNTGTQKGCSLCERQVLGHLDHIALVENNLARVTTVSGLAITVVAVVGTIVGVSTLGTVLLFTLGAVVAVAAAVHKAANTSLVTHCKLGDTSTDLSDDASDFVTSNHGELAAVPLTLQLVKIRVADTTVLDLNTDIACTDRAALEGPGLELGTGSLGGVGLGSLGHFVIIEKEF